MLKWLHGVFKRKDAVSTYQNHNSLMFTNSQRKNDKEFTGSIDEYLKKSNTIDVDCITVAGSEIKPGMIDSSMTLDPSQLEQFMRVISERKIKALNFAGCHLDPKAGAIIGAALQENHTLKTLGVCSSQLKKEGMLAILNGLKNNRSITEILCDSYNVDRYRLSLEEIQALVEVISNNRTLKTISLPDNQIANHEHLALLVEPYKTITDRELPTISKAEIAIWGDGLAGELPDFNHKNIEQELLTPRSERTHSSMKASI